MHSTNVQQKFVIIVIKIMPIFCSNDVSSLKCINKWSDIVREKSHGTNVPRRGSRVQTNSCFWVLLTVEVNYQKWYLIENWIFSVKAKYVTKQKRKCISFVHIIAFWCVFNCALVAYIYITIANSSALTSSHFFLLPFRFS